MDDASDAIERMAHRVGVEHGGFDEVRAVGDARAQAGREIVEDRHLATGGEQVTRDMGADVARSPGEQPPRHAHHRVMRSDPR